MCKIVYSRNDKLPQQNDFVLISMQDKFEEALSNLTLSGDLIVDAQNKIVTDKEWAFSDYQKRMIEKQIKANAS